MVFTSVAYNIFICEGGSDARPDAERLVVRQSGYGSVDYCVTFQIAVQYKCTHGARFLPVGANHTSDQGIINISVTQKYNVEFRTPKWLCSLGYVNDKGVQILGPQGEVIIVLLCFMHFATLSISMALYSWL
jgi:hypothetical protein